MMPESIHVDPSFIQGKECQRASWATHRPQCHHRQQLKQAAALQVGDPEFVAVQEHMDKALGRFIERHRKVVRFLHHHMFTIDS